MSTSPAPGVECRSASSVEAAAATGSVRWILRAEGGVALVMCLGFYALTGFGWIPFALLFLVPDLSMLGYLAGPRIGARAYNAAHSTIGPLLLGSAGFMLGIAPLPPLSLIWAAHIGFDRLLGYGLKYPQGFGYTHLGRIGRAARRSLRIS